MIGSGFDKQGIPGMLLAAGTQCGLWVGRWGRAALQRMGRTGHRASFPRGSELSQPLARVQMDNYIELTQISSADSIVNYFLALSRQRCI